VVVVVVMVGLEVVLNTALRFSEMFRDMESRRQVDLEPPK